MSDKQNTFEHGDTDHDVIMSITAPNTPTIPTLNANPISINIIAIKTMNDSLRIPAVSVGHTKMLSAFGSGIRTFIVNCCETPVRLPFTHLTSHV